MENCKTIELTITPNYISDWDFGDAVRELIQNGIDQQTIDPSNKLEISYDADEETLRLTNPKSALEINTLLLGCSSKTNNKETVGQFGEGYKIAALVLNRLGKTFTAYNYSKNETWISKFEDSATFKEKVLVFKIYSQPTYEKGLTIEIENVDESEYKSLYEVWLGMPGSVEHEKIETQYGDIFTDEEMRGKVFVNGLAVESNSGKYFGYNFKPEYITLERDRKSCNSWDMSKVTGNMIIEAMKAGEIEAKDVLNICNEDSFSDISYLQYATWRSDVRYLSDMLVKEFDSQYRDAIPVSSQSDYDKVKNMGGKPVIVPYYISQIVASETNSRIATLAENVWGGDFTIKQKLEQWHDFYEEEIPTEAIDQLNKILNMMEQ